MKKLYLTSLFLFFFSLAKSQNLQFAQRFILGNSVTHIWNRGTFGLHHETTWNANFAINLNKSIYVGMMYEHLFTTGSLADISPEGNDFQIFGLFTQYDFLPKKRNRIFVELSYHYGDYCTCGANIEPFREPELQSIGYGIGGDISLNNWLSLDLAFKNHDILNDIPFKYNRTQYIVGLNLDLVSKR